MKILNLLLEMSYNMPKMLRSKFQSPSIEIEDICLRESVRERKRDREREGQGAPIELD